MTKLRQQKNSHVKILFDMHVLQLSVLEKYWPALHTDAGTKVCAETLFIKVKSSKKPIIIQPQNG